MMTQPKTGSKWPWAKWDTDTQLSIEELIAAHIFDSSEVSVNERDACDLG